MVPAEAPNDKEENEAEKKKVAKLDRKVDKWVWHPFKNPARTDNTQFSHWMKKKETSEEYPFARFNRKANVVTYTDE